MSKRRASGVEDGLGILGFGQCKKQGVGGFQSMLDTEADKAKQSNDGHDDWEQATIGRPAGAREAQQQSK